jgi:hypothetical protein
MKAFRKPFWLLVALAACGGQPEVQLAPPEGFLLALGWEGSFGQTVVDAPKEAEVSLGDVGSAFTPRPTEPLKVSSITATGTGVQMTHECGANYERSECAIHLRFAPTAPGTMVGELRVLSNHRDGPLVLPLSGLAVATAQPPLAIGVFDGLTRVDFGTVDRGITVTRALVVRNVGNAAQPLSVGLGAQTGGDGNWTLATDCNLPVAIGGTCTANVSFAPSVAASASALVDVTDNYRTPGFVRQAVQLNGVGR